VADFCQNPNGPFDGMKMTTARDRQLCREAGGTVVSRPDQPGAGDGCSGATVQRYSLASGESVDVNALYASRTLFASSREVSLLLRLSERAAPVVESILLEDAALARKLVSGLERLSRIGERVLGRESRKQPYTKADHAALSRLARAVAERAEDQELEALVEEATRLGASLQGKGAAAIRRRLGPVPRPPTGPSKTTEFEVAVPPAGIDPGVFRLRGWHHLTGRAIEGVWDELPAAVVETEIGEASEKISEKAAELGWAKTPLGGVRRLFPGAYVQRFAECDIYYSPQTGAHEVHGDIRAKYDLVTGPFLLGLPTTDERPCGDGRGQHNHFAYDASIYWTPTTGPFYLRGPVRFRWASEGWQASGFGYPVRDEERMSGIVPGVDPDMRWNMFENGIVFGQGGDGRKAVRPPDPISAQRIANEVRNAFDKRLVKAAYQVGLISFEFRPGLYGAEVLGVDEWQYGFLGAAPRTLRIRINGFISVPIASDPTFELDLGLRFETAWQVGPTFLYPDSKTIAARLVSLRVAVHGVASEKFALPLRDAVKEAFRPDPATNPELVDGQLALLSMPTGARQGPKPEDVNLDFLDVVILSDGSLGVELNPLPPERGFVRRVLAGQMMRDRFPPE
jgi:LGFP repeat